MYAQHRYQLVGPINEQGAEQEAKTHRQEGVLAFLAVQFRFLGHFNGGRQQGPKWGGRHDAGCESEAGVEQFPLKNDLFIWFCLCLRLGSNLRASDYDD